MYRDRYRTRSTRLEGWDYSAYGYYFVTFCTKDKQPFLGKVIEGVIHLTPAGEIVREEILRTADIRLNVTVESWVVMPNHVHCIIGIHSDNEVETPHACEGV